MNAGRAPRIHFAVPRGWQSFVVLKQVQRSAKSCTQKTESSAGIRAVTEYGKIAALHHSITFSVLDFGNSARSRAVVIGRAAGRAVGSVTPRWWRTTAGDSARTQILAAEGMRAQGNIHRVVHRGPHFRPDVRFRTVSKIRS